MIGREIFELENPEKGVHREEKGRKPLLYLHIYRPNLGIFARNFNNFTFH